MDLATALTKVTMLTPERKQELISRHLKGQLTDADRDELKVHLAKAIVHLEREQESAQYLQELLSV